MLSHVQRYMCIRYMSVSRSSNGLPISGLRSESVRVVILDDDLPLILRFVVLLCVVFFFFYRRTETIRIIYCNIYKSFSYQKH